jgi:hypothetical protein
MGSDPAPAGPPEQVPSLDDLASSYPYTEACLKEVLRLFPPAHTTTREVRPPVLNPPLLSKPASLHLCSCPCPPTVCTVPDPPPCTQYCDVAHQSRVHAPLKSPSPIIHRCLQAEETCTIGGRYTIQKGTWVSACLPMQGHAHCFGALPQAHNLHNLWPPPHNTLAPARTGPHQHLRNPPRSSALDRPRSIQA